MSQNKIIVPNIGDIVLIKEANADGRTNLPPGPILIRVLPLDSPNISSQTFLGIQVNDHSGITKWCSEKNVWYYLNEEIVKIVKPAHEFSRPKGKLIGNYKYQT